MPTYLYNLDTHPTATPFYPDRPPVALYPRKGEPAPDAILPSGELAIPIIEGLACGVRQELAAVNIPNRGNYVPGLPAGAVVEVPATVDARGLHPMSMPPLPEGPLALLRTQTSIHQLLVDAFREKSRDRLLQALLLDPTVHSYANAVHLINEMCERQKEVLPEMHWQTD